ncbi:DUF3619 family protein [Aquabacterium sp.]|uniref:DUF3619 family protein n=1 Tax=Aquabacterium sp. TaxID=1872578 RepID=UPI00351D9BDE
MKSPNTPLSSAQIEAIEARFALRVSARLDDSAKALPHDITERLRVAREQAVRAAVLARPQVAVVTAPEYAPSRQLAGVSMAGSGSSGQASLSGWGDGMQHRDASHGRNMDDGPLPWGWRLASALPALALVMGLWGIHIWYQSEKVQAASDVDMALLTDDLPPAAYADPGFEEYLQTEPPISAEPALAETDESALAESDGEASDESEGSDGEAEAQP